MFITYSIGEYLFLTFDTAIEHCKPLKFIRFKKVAPVLVYTCLVYILVFHREFFIFLWNPVHLSAVYKLDLSRFRAAPSARLGHFPFECDRAFPTQC